MPEAPNPDDAKFMRLAYEEARRAYESGGVPVGAVMVKDSEVIGSGHNKRVQDGDPTAHGEMDCARNAGQLPSYKGVSLYTTLCPCMMCMGMVLQFGIERVVIGDRETFPGNIDFLRERGVEVVLLDDPDCVALMKIYVQEQPDYLNYLAKSDRGDRPAER